MARRPFGGGPADFVSWRNPSTGMLLVQTGDVTFWTAETDGTQITDLLDPDGSAASQIATDSSGQIPTFQGPVDGTQVMWAEGPSSASRQRLESADQPSRLAAAEAAITTGAAGAVQRSANLSDLASAATARSNLGLGSAATQASSAFDAAGAAAAVTKSSLGLGSVDNTADTAKPVSTAQQTALDAKAPLASPALTGAPTAPTPAAGDNSTKVATTAFVVTQNATSAPLPGLLKNPLTGWFHASGYGVKADGATDDTGAWQTLLTAVGAAGGGIVAHPGGVSVTDELNVPADTHLRLGPLDTLKLKNSAARVLRLQARAKLTGGTLDCSAASATGVVHNGDYSVTEDVTIVGATGNAITGGNVHRPIARNNRITGSATTTGSAIYFEVNGSAANDFIGPVIEGNLVDLSASSPSTFAATAIYIYGVLGGSYQYRRGTIRGNRVTMPASPTSSAAVCITVRRAPGTVVTDNRTLNGSMGVSFDTTVGGSVSNNVFLSPSLYGVEMPASSGVSVTGNRIDGGGLATAGVITDGQAAGDGNSIGLNTVIALASGGTGVKLGASFTNTGVVGNTLAVPINGHGVYVAAGCAKTTVNGNTIDAAGAAGTNGITFDTPQDCTICGNTVEGVTSNSVRLGASTAVTLDYITVAGNTFHPASGGIGYGGSFTGGAVLGSNVTIAGNSDGICYGGSVLRSAALSQDTLQVRASASQTGRLVRFIDASSADKFSMTVNGNSAFSGGLSVAGIQGSAASAGVLRVTGSGSGPSLNVTQNVGSTADVATFHDNTDAARSRVNYNGLFITKAAAAPVLADLVDGETAWWVDSSGNPRYTSRVSGALKSGTVTVA